MIYAVIAFSILTIIGVWILFDSYNHEGWGFLSLTIGVVGLFGCLLTWVENNDKKRCAEILSMARTNSDSINVLVNCGKRDTNIILQNSYVPAER